MRLKQTFSMGYIRFINCETDEYIGKCVVKNYYWYRDINSSFTRKDHDAWGKTYYL